MKTFVRKNPPEDKILSKKYWKRHDDSNKSYISNPVGFQLCPECGLYFPVFLRGQRAELCYRCRKKERKKYLKTVRLSKENFDYVSENIKHFSTFVNELIKEHRKDRAAKGYY